MSKIQGHKYNEISPLNQIKYKCPFFITKVAGEPFLWGQNTAILNGDETAIECELIFGRSPTLTLEFWWILPECSINYFHEGSLFAEDKALGLRHVEILTRFRGRLQARAIGLISGETIECDQTPGHIIRAFIREKIPDKVPTTSRNNAAPILGVFLERVSLEWINLIADKASYLHRYPHCR